VPVTATGRHSLSRSSAADVVEIVAMLAAGASRFAAITVFCCNR